MMFNFIKPKKGRAEIPYHVAILVYCNEDGSLDVTSIKSMVKNQNRNIQAAEVLINAALKAIEKELEKDKTHA